MTFIRATFEESPLRLVEDVLTDARWTFVMGTWPQCEWVAAVDQPRAMCPGELALDFAVDSICDRGGFISVFHGQGFDDDARCKGEGSVVR